MYRCLRCTLNKPATSGGSTVHIIGRLTYLFGSVYMDTASDLSTDSWSIIKEPPPDPQLSVALLLGTVGIMGTGKSAYPAPPSPFSVGKDAATEQFSPH